MKRQIFIAFFVILTFAFAQNVMAQNPGIKPSPTADPKGALFIPDANPADVSSMDAIIKAVYDVISGEAGQKRDWNRFRSLFYPGARMIGTGKNPNTGIYGARAVSPDDYIKRNEPYFEKNAFFEREKVRRVEEFGNIAHVFSTYESFNKVDDKTPFERGINSIQLINDGKRWWVMTIMWQGESKDTVLPKKYLKSGK